MIKGFILSLLYVHKFEKSGKGFPAVLRHFFQVRLYHRSGASIFRQNNLWRILLILECNNPAIEITFFSCWVRCSEISLSRVLHQLSLRRSTTDRTRLNYNFLLQQSGFLLNCQFPSHYSRTWKQIKESGKKSKASFWRFWCNFD